MLSGRTIAMAALVLVFAVGVTARADDGDTEKSKTEEKAAKKEKEKAEKAAKKEAKEAEKAEKEKEKTEKAEKKEEHGGNCFTRFWVHTVGGTIGNGLKGGAEKIDHGI